MISSRRLRAPAPAARCASSTMTMSQGFLVSLSISRVARCQADDEFVLAANVVPPVRDIEWEVELAVHLLSPLITEGCGAQDRGRAWQGRAVSIP